jgi:WXXGXW repeat (2 copies)
MRPTILALTLALSVVPTLIPSPAVARVRVYVSDEAPPPPREEIVHPRHGYVWVGGHHVHHRHGYSWSRGHYARERRGYEWRDGTWEHRGPHYEWHDGGWHR